MTHAHAEIGRYALPVRGGAQGGPAHAHYETPDGADRLPFSVWGYQHRGEVPTDDRGDNSDDGAMPANHPLGVHPGSREIDEDIGIEYNLATYR